MLPPPRELPEAAPRLSEGRYVLMARIGRGGMAGVYAAWDLATEEWRAVKVLLPKHARDKGLRSRFEREGETMKALRHPNLVRVYDVGIGEKLPFLVMELINAGSLYRWTKTLGPMPPRMAVEAMIQLCEGLTAVHGAGVVHRDIKPRNVLINWDGVLKLTDFGIAQLSESQDTRTGLAMGTLGFMSPEQLHDSKSVDLRTDIYAVGATLWSQLTARKARDLFRLEDKPELMDGVPEPIRPLLARCLAYERHDRYSSAKALATGLMSVLDQLPEDPPESPPLPLNLSLSFKSKPENTFSEILTTMHPGEDLANEPMSEEPGLSEDSSPSGLRPARPLTLPNRRPTSRPPTADPPRQDSLAPRRDRLAEAESRRDTPRPSRPPEPSGASDPGAPGSRHSSEVRPSEPRTTGGRSSLRPSAPIAPGAVGDEPLPSYLEGVQQTNDHRRPEIITYEPDEKAGSSVIGGPPRWLLRVLLLLFVAPVAAIAGSVLMVMLVAGLGTWEVRSANGELRREQEELSDQIEAESALRTDLLSLGAQTGPIEQAFARWTQTTSEPDRTEAALEYLMLAEQESQQRIGLTQRSHEEAVVTQRLERLAKARAELLGAEEAWNGAKATPQGQLAILLRLAPVAP